MALVVVTISDTPDGTIDMQLVTEPSFKREDDLTPAQQTALLMLDAVATPDDVMRIEA